MIVAFAIILAFLGGLGYYLARRIHRGMLSLGIKIKLWVTVVFFSVMTLIMALAFGSPILPFPTVIKTVLMSVGFCWMGIFVYLLLFALLCDLAHIIFKLCRAKFISHARYRGICAILVVSLALSVSVYGFCNARCIQKVDYKVDMTHGEDISDINIVMISDLHLGAVGSESRLEDIVERINAQNPDLVCIAGDFFDTDFGSIVDVDAAKATLRKLNSTYGVYACLGNHDAGETFAQMKQFLKDSNVTLLSEDYRIIDNRFALVGRADASPIGGYGKEERKKLSDFFAPSEGMPVIVMEHNPARIGEYSGSNYLILSGHTHEGQMFPASILTGLMYEVDHGYYQKDENSPHVIVSSGIGYWGMPMRVGTNSEIVNISISG